MQIKRITTDNLDSVILEMLSQPHFFEQIEDVVYEIEAGAAPEEARQAFIQLTNLIDTAGINRENLTSKYLKILLALRLISLSLVKDEEKGKFIEENIVMLLRQDYADLMFWLRLIFAMYEYDKNIVQELQRTFIQAIENSNDLLGKTNIVIGDKEVMPFVKYWVVDFKSFPSPRVQKGPLEENTYLSQGINTKVLDNNDLAVLRKILRIYDWLRFQVTIPVRQNEELEALHRSRETTQPQTAGMQMPYSPHGADLEAYKQKIGKIQSLKPVNMTPTEIKREMDTPELPRPPMTKFQPIPPAMPRLGNIPTSTYTQPRGLNFLADINMVDDLKKINLAHLRQGVLSSQVNLIKSKIVYLAQVNKLLSYYTVNAFEQSPLFRLYLTLGGQVIADNSPNRRQAFEQAAKKMESQGQTSMTISEFEAIADLRKEIEKL